MRHTSVELFEDWQNHTIGKLVVPEVPFLASLTASTNFGHFAIKDNVFDTLRQVIKFEFGI